MTRVGKQRPGRKGCAVRWKVGQAVQPSQFEAQLRPLRICPDIFIGPLESHAPAREIDEFQPHTRGECEARLPEGMIELAKLVIARRDLAVLEAAVRRDSPSGQMSDHKRLCDLLLRTDAQRGEKRPESLFVVNLKISEMQQHIAPRY